MALFHVRVVIDRSAVGQDQVIWNLFGVDTAVDPELLAPDLLDAFQFKWENDLNYEQWAIDHFFTALELIPAGGGPAAGYAGFVPPLEMGTGLPGVGEVCVVVSHQVDTVRGQRRRGRTYAGPLSYVPQQARPDESLMDSLGGLWVAMHEAAEALFAGPVVISTVLNGAPRVPPVGIPIVSYLVDDAWDTQRSRGWAASSTETYTPA